MTDIAHMGATIRKLREFRGLTQAELSDALHRQGVDLHQTTLSKVERGQRDLFVSQASGIASALGVTLLDLTGSPVQDVIDRAVEQYEAEVKLARVERALAKILEGLQ